MEKIKKTILIKEENYTVSAANIQAWDSILGLNQYPKPVGDYVVGVPAGYPDISCCLVRHLSSPRMFLEPFMAFGDLDRLGFEWLEKNCREFFLPNILPKHLEIQASWEQCPHYPAWEQGHIRIAENLGLKLLDA
jgi:hypothetical protein